MGWDSVGCDDMGWMIWDGKEREGKGGEGMGGEASRIDTGNGQ